MASPKDPNNSSRRAAGAGAQSPPPGAQAENELTPSSSTAGDAGVEVGRNPRERASRQTQNTIWAAVDTGPSKSIPRTAESVGTVLRDMARGVIPERVARRYSQVGDDYHFPDGNVAFRDEGHRLSTKLENREVIRDLVAIAKDRGWSIEISGTKEFQRRAWQEAQVAGLTVRNYEASELERQQLARRLGRERAAAPEAGSGGSPVSASAGESAGTTSSPAERPPARDPAPAPAAADRVYRGRLVDHGIDRYQFDPRNDESYYVILDSPEHGEQLIWGKDLQRALEKSLSKPREGAEVVVRQLGAKPVTVSRPVRDEDGQVIAHQEVKSHLNRWLVETAEFLQEREKLAAVVRDVGTDPKRAVAQHPELAGTYSELHAARLVALHQNYRHPADVERFVSRTREAIAEEIERGEPLSPPLVKARYHRAPTQRSQEQVQQRTL